MGKFCSCQWQSDSPHFHPTLREASRGGGPGALRVDALLGPAPQKAGAGAAPPREDRREGDTEPGYWGVRPPSEHAVRGSPRREKKSKSTRKPIAGMPSLRNPLGRSQKPSWVPDSFWKKLSKRRLSPPLKSCTPVFIPPHSLVAFLAGGGLLKGPSGAAQVIPDGPGRHTGAGTLAAGICPLPIPRTPTPRLGAPHCSLPRLADPSWPRRAGAEGEDGVTRRGARGPGRGAGESQAREPGRCGRGWEEEGGARREVSRAEPGGEAGEPRGGPAPASRSRLSAASEPAHFASRLWTAAGRLLEPRPEGAPGTGSHPAPAPPPGARAPRGLGGRATV